MTDDRRVALLEAFSAAWNAKDLNAVMDLMADHCEFRSSVGPEPGTHFAGRDEVRRGFEIFLKPSDAPQPQTVHEEMLVTGDFAVTRWTLRMPGADASSSDVRGCDVFEFDGDRIKLKDTYRKVAGTL
jgi:ketosteroid isomerase-like protein